MTKAQQGGVRFLMTRVVVGAGAVGTLLGTWSVVAVTAADGGYEETPAEETLVLATIPETAAAPVAVAAAGDTAAEAPGVIVVERQPVVYVTEYVTLPAAASDPGTAPAAVAAPAASTGGEPAASAPAAAAPATEPAAAAAVPAQVFPTPVVVIPIAPPPAAPVAPAPAAPVAPQPVTAPAPTVAPAPPSAPPKPAATSKKSRGS